MGMNLGGIGHLAWVEGFAASGEKLMWDSYYDKYMVIPKWIKIGGAF